MSCLRDCFTLDCFLCTGLLGESLRDLSTIEAVERVESYCGGNI